MKVNRRIRSSPDPVAALRAGIDGPAHGGLRPRAAARAVVASAFRTTSACSIAPPPWSGCATAGQRPTSRCGSSISRQKSRAVAVNRLFGAAGTRDLARRAGAGAARRAAAGAPAGRRPRAPGADRRPPLPRHRSRGVRPAARRHGLPAGQRLGDAGRRGARRATASACSTSAPAAASRRCRSRRARRGVIAVDIGARAAAMARANARLNDARCVEVRCGDLYAPVRGERFDLIIANPPFVPARTRGPAYHSGGPRGDRVLRRVVEGLGGAPASRRPRRGDLAPGGAARRDGRRRRCGPGWATSTGACWRWCSRPARRSIWRRRRPLRARRRLRRLRARGASTGSPTCERHRIEQVVLLLLAAERSGSAALEVVEAFQRTLPLPLSKSPPTLVAEWLART